MHPFSYVDSLLINANQRVVLANSQLLLLFAFLPFNVLPLLLNLITLCHFRYSDLLESLLRCIAEQALRYTYSLESISAVLMYE